MIKIEKIDYLGEERALEAMRNPLESWDKATMEADKKLASTLVKAGDEHAKFERMIHVQMDITAPLYWWKQFDTYKIGVTAESTSTMHTLHKHELTTRDFSCELVSRKGLLVLQLTIDRINTLLKDYRTSKDIEYWEEAIQLLPSSYNQMRTVDMSLQTLRRIVEQRKGHKLTEWRTFCKTFDILDWED